MFSLRFALYACVGLAIRVSGDTPYFGDFDAGRLGFGDLGLAPTGNGGVGGFGPVGMGPNNDGRVGMRQMDVNSWIGRNSGFNMGGTMNGDMSRDGFVNNLGRTGGVDSWSRGTGIGGLDMDPGFAGNVGMGGGGVLDNGMAGVGGSINVIGVPLGSGAARPYDGLWYQGNDGGMLGDNGFDEGPMISGGPVVSDGPFTDDRSAIMGPMGGGVDPTYGVGGVVGVKAGVSKHTHTTRVVRPVIKQLVRPIVRPVINRIVRPIIQRPVIRRVVRPIIRPIIQRVVRPIIRPVVRRVVRPIVRKVFRPIIRNVIRQPTISAGVRGLMQRPPMQKFRKWKTYW